MTNNIIGRREFIQSTAKVIAATALASSIGLPRALGAPAPVILITGTSSGFGFRMALTFARAGYKTYASMRNIAAGNQESAQRLLEAARHEGLFLEVIELDVTATEQAKGVVDEIIRREGRIDILINNAGAFVFTPIEIVPRDLWDFQMRTNVYGPMELVGLVMPHMRAQRVGLIIQVSSRVGSFVIPGISLYATSKFALEAASEAAHYEATHQGIDFAIIQPGAFNTEVNRNARKIFASITWPLLLKERPAGESHYRDFLQTLDGNFSGQPPRDPQEVANLALRIAGTPRSERVLRYAVGDAWEIDPLRNRNQQIANFQRQAMQDAGFSHLYRP